MCDLIFNFRFILMPYGGAKMEKFKNGFQVLSLNMHMVPAEARRIVLWPNIARILVMV